MLFYVVLLQSVDFKMSVYVESLHNAPVGPCRAYFGIFARKYCKGYCRKFFVLQLDRLLHAGSNRSRGPGSRNHLAARTKSNIPASSHNVSNQPIRCVAATPDKWTPTSRFSSSAFRVRLGMLRQKKTPLFQRQMRIGPRHATSSSKEKCCTWTLNLT